MNQFIERLSKLPRSQRLAVFGLAYIAIVLVFYFLFISPTMSDISAMQTQQAELEKKRDEVKKRADNRAAFEAELEHLTNQLKKALKELPNDREIPGLLSEIDALARKSGLEVRRFQPLPEVKHEYYAEVPVAIMMDGGYHEVGIFFDRVSKMNRIVSVRDVGVGAPKEHNGDVTLTINGNVVTYRFLTDAEIKAAQQGAKPRAAPPAGGEGGD